MTTGEDRAAGEVLRSSEHSEQSLGVFSQVLLSPSIQRYCTSLGHNHTKRLEEIIPGAHKGKETAPVPTSRTENFLIHKALEKVLRILPQ